MLLHFCKYKILAKTGIKSRHVVIRGSSYIASTVITNRKPLVQTNGKNIYVLTFLTRENNLILKKGKL